MNKPPNPINVLSNILRAHAAKRHAWPTAMPMRPEDGALWWQEHQAPPARGEQPKQVPIHGKDEGMRWDFPYCERLACTLRKFLTLQHDEHRIILAAWEDGIPWRGEDTRQRYAQFEGRTLFENIIHEIERTRAMGRDKYIVETRKRARGAVKHMQERE